MLFQSSLFALSLLVAGSSAAPIPQRREVPQEHSHEAILTAVRTLLNLDNSLFQIQDPVFGLLGNAAALGGIGNFPGGPDCLQTGTADVAFTNAKAAGDIAGMTSALQFRALERNTGGVGTKSVLCTAFTPANPEIAALTQHQDPASEGAAATNKAIVLELARQINSVGGDPQDALDTGTFAPGDLGDVTGAGNTCDDITPEGCIFTKNLIVFDATPEEIIAAVAGETAATPVAVETPAATEVVVEDAAEVAECPPTVTVTVTADVAIATAIAAVVDTAPAAIVTAAPVVAVGGNLQTFTGAIGGIAAPTVVTGGRGFQVEGNASFPNIQNALIRSCDVQGNKCKNAANAQVAGVVFDDCTAQQVQCEIPARA
ncbi:hypothetical protein BDY24DRAFT_441337 [Mrakia frigida]|uniref:uncharacterized protein n=1 Tax=Mrakia frigida TaxID=29902 RepID=UPI003FCC18A8